MYVSDGGASAPGKIRNGLVRTGDCTYIQDSSLLIVLSVIVRAVATYEDIKPNDGNNVGMRHTFA